ncbi:hypothetical protein BDF22DRAFT_742031 [Syncephalis plumigaleata]|nr:hypothetical protein BDF22DRAFT_742031 [Syncephalis plumigaleata]
MLPLPLNSTATELIQEELNELKAETQWLLNSEFDTLSMELKSEYQDRMPFYSQGETLVLSTPNSEILKGFVRLEGSNLVKVRSTDKVTMATDCVYPLDQIDLLHRETAILNDLIQHMTCPIDLNDGKKMISALMKQIDKVLSLFQPTAAQSFPKKSYDPKIFNPILNEQIAVEFNIENTDLVATIRVLKYHKTPPVRYRSLIYGWVEPPPVYPWLGRLAQVMETVQVHSAVPSLADLWNSLRSIRVLCAAYRDKLIAIDEASRS